MNLPNRLSISRLFLAPVFFVVFFLPEWLPLTDSGSITRLSAWALLVIYIVIELSDLLDGFIARRWNMITDLGKVLDPYADVISRITYFFCLSFTGIMPLWIFLIIVYRELSVIFLRMLLMRKGTAMAASMLGKAKAVLYAVAGLGGIVCAFTMRLYPEASWLQLYMDILFVLFILTGAAALFSGVVYFRKAARSGLFEGFSR